MYSSTVRSWVEWAYSRHHSYHINRNALPGRSADEHQDSLRAQYSQRSKSIFGHTDCHLCQGTIGDFIHLCTVCTHPAMIRRRRAALGDGRWAAHISAIVVELYRAHSCKAPTIWLMEAIEDMDIESCEARFITAWHITGYAWSASKAELEWRVALTLGKLFDRDVTLSEYRPVAWSKAGSKELMFTRGDF